MMQLTEAVSESRLYGNLIGYCKSNNIYVYRSDKAEILCNYIKYINCLELEPVSFSNYYSNIIGTRSPARNPIIQLAHQIGHLIAYSKNQVVDNECANYEAAILIEKLSEGIYIKPTSVRRWLDKILSAADSEAGVYYMKPKVIECNKLTYFYD